MSTSLHELPTPFAVVDLDRVEQNAARMRAFAERRGVRLRPHVKTHKCVPAARIALGAAVGPITVSTLAEASHFASAGFHDITYAVPLAVARIEEALTLTSSLELTLLVDHRVTAAALGDAARARSMRARVMVKVDCGYHRAGVEPHRPEALALVEQVVQHPGLRFVGLLTHAGHSYDCVGPEALREVAETERVVTVAFAEALRARGIAVPEVSIGSTPTMSVEPELDGVSEIRPGNYLLFDAFQAAIGSCTLEDAAFSVVASVISHHPDAGRLVLDAGALALSKDAGATHPPSGLRYGVLTDLDGHELADLALVSLSQEHGVVRGSREAVAAQSIGTRLRIVANHSCLAAACHPHFEVARGLTIVDRWTPARAW